MSVRGADLACTFWIAKNHFENQTFDFLKVYNDEEKAINFERNLENRHIKKMLAESAPPHSEFQLQDAILCFSGLDTLRKLNEIVKPKFL